MKLYILITAISVVLLTAACRLPFFRVDIGKRGSEPRITLYNKGRTLLLDAKSPAYKTLTATMEEALTSAHDILKLAVSTERIQEFKTKQISLEILYSEPKELRVTKFARTVKLDRMLVPLSGEFAVSPTKQKFVTVFYGLREYGPGPYTNDGKFQDKLRGLLAKMGHKI